MPEPKDVAVTAFIVNESRARLKSVSKDVYAHLWVTDETRALWETLAREVYAHDDVNLSVRNRFYLEQVKGFLKGVPHGIFINLGAGFTSYPYLLDENVYNKTRCIEVDQAQVMLHKAARVREFITDGALPRRDVEHYSLDFEEADLADQFEQDITAWCSDTPTIVIMEGLTYYLSSDTLKWLFSILGNHLCKNSKIVFDFWGPKSDDSPVIQHVRKYLAGLAQGRAPEFCYLDMHDIQELPGTEVVEHIDIAKLERRFSDTRVLQSAESRFPTEFVVMEVR